MLCFYVFRRPQRCLISPASVASSFSIFFKAQKVFSAKKNWTAWTPLEFLEFFDYWNSDWKFFENSPVLVGRLSISFPWLNSECLALLQPWRNRCLRAQPHEVWHEKIADWWRIPHWKTKKYISVSYLICELYFFGSDFVGRSLGAPILSWLKQCKTFRIQPWKWNW